MRIRHPRTDSSTNSVIENLEHSPEDIKKNQFESGKLSEQSMKLAEIPFNFRNISPQLSADGGYISSVSAGTDNNEDTNTTYLNPDFMDSHISEKCESIGPSPLALLARTCQNIGNQMDSTNQSNKPIGVTSTTPRKSSSTHPINLSSTRNATNPTPTKVSKPKTPNLPTDLGQQSYPSKRQSVTKRPLSGSESSSQTVTSPYTNDSNRCSSLNVSPKLRVTEYEPMMSNHLENLTKSTTSSPLNSCSIKQMKSQFDQYDLKQCTNYFNQPSPESNQTSNSLAQLARLSSSFSLPDPPKSTNFSFKRLTQSPENRSRWQDSSRLNNTSSSNINNHNNCTNIKRLKKTPPCNMKTNVSDHVINSNSVKKSFKDTQSYLQSNMFMSTNTNAGSTNTMSNSNALNMSMNSKAPNPLINPQSPNWPAFLKYSQQLFEHKDLPNRTSATDESEQQETFSYHLARSFLDYFYSKMMSAQNSDSSINSNGLSCPKDLAELDSHSQIKMDYRQVLMEKMFKSEINGANIGQNHSLTQPIPPPMGNKCMVCGQSFYTRTELCFHVYAHLLSFKENEQNNLSMEQQQQLLLMAAQSQSMHLSQQQQQQLTSRWAFGHENDLQTNSSTLDFNRPQNLLSNGIGNHSESQTLFNSYLMNWLTSLQACNLVSTSSSTSALPATTTTITTAANNNSNACLNTTSTDATNLQLSNPNASKTGDTNSIWQHVLSTYFQFLSNSSMSQNSLNQFSSLFPPFFNTNSSLRSDNPNWYDALQGSNTFITPFPQV